MPQKFSDALDENLLFDGCVSFSGGQVSATRHNLVPETAFVEGKNIDIDQWGDAVTRRGANWIFNTITGTWDTISTAWGSWADYWGYKFSTGIRGVCFVEYGTAQYLMVADSGASDNIKLIAATGAISTVSGSTVSGSAIRVYFAQIANRVYFCDGTSATGLKYVDLSSPASAVTVTNGKISSVEVGARGSGYNNTVTVGITAPVGAGAALTPTVGYGGAIAKVTVTSGGSSYSGSNPPILAFSGGAGSGATATARVSAVPPSPKLLLAHTGRFFCATGDATYPPDTLFASNFLDGEAWDMVRNSIRIGGDGDPITAMVPWYDYILVVFKRRSTWLVNCDPTLDMASWEVKQVSAGVGCVAERSPIVAGGDVFFLSNDGVRNVKMLLQGTLATVGSPISNSIDDLLDQAGQATLYKAAGVYYRNRYLLAVAKDSSSNDTVLPFHFGAGNWCGYWTGWNPIEFCITSFGGVNRLVWASADGYVYTWSDVTAEANEDADDYTDYGAGYESFLVTRAMDHGEKFTEKLGHHVQFELENKMAANARNAVPVTFAYAVNLSDNFHQLGAVIITPGTQWCRKNYPLASVAPYSCISFKATAASGKLALQGIKVSATQNNILADQSR